MHRSLLLLAGLACNPPDVEDSVLPDHPTGKTVGVPPLEFYDRTPKNVIFLSIDTFRKDHLGVHGNLKGITPFLDTIAGEGVVLDDHLQCSCWTFASTTCTLAGRYNFDRGHLPRLNGTDEQRPKVAEGTPFLSTWLGEAGYYSILVSGNDWLSKTWGNAQGFNEVLKPGGMADAVYDTGSKAMREAIDRGQADKWFMHLHFMEPHAAYDPPEDNIIGEENVEPWPGNLTDRPTHYEARDEWPQMLPAEQALLEANLRLLYEAELRTIDERLEGIWNNLEAEGYLDDTLVVIWNDHGEQFWEHEHQTHAFELFGEENDGFAIFWSRNIVPGRWSGPTASIDLVPTILDLVGAPIPAEVTGIKIGTAPEDRVRYGEALARSGGVTSVTKEGLKLHYRWTGKITFYDRNVDPIEQNNVYSVDDPRVLELWSYLRPVAEDMAGLVVGGTPAPVWPAGLP
jgi:arylsulfatase A-like enzyme